MLEDGDRPDESVAESEAGFVSSLLRKLPSFLAVSLLAGWVLLALLFLPFVLVFQFLQERRLVRHIKPHGRFIAWRELEPRLVNGEGALVVEQAQKQRHRLWWTPEKPLAVGPVSPPPEEELDFLRLMKPHPFVDWCQKRYLSAETGTALLTAPPSKYLPGFVKAAFFLERFPSLQVVMTVKA
jgi:hypothetical protein